MAIRLPRSDEINKKIEDAGIEQLTYAKYGLNGHVAGTRRLDVPPFIKLLPIGALLRHGNFQ
jgi:hypothetical protein